ncbi:MAG: outer membrane beta-barrel protein [Verrucomicrobiales bacterium]|nr:outer membrane beta-barrel protein [Verrucomicrobiales bacterium]
MKKSVIYFIGAALTMTSLSVADTAPQYQIKDGQIVPASKSVAPADAPAFRSDAAPRQEKENYVALWGGINVLQDGDFRAKDSLGLGIDEKLSLKNQFGYAAGVKVGHTWDLTTGDNAADQSMRLQFSLEGEFIYTTADTKMKWSGYDVLDGKMDIYALTVNPILRFDLGTFRPYVGVGVGGALINEKANNFGVWSNPPYNIVSDHSTNSTVVLAFQGIAGTDIVLNDSWSLFFEYKFLGLLDFKHDVTYLAQKIGKIDSNLCGNHLLAVGVKLHY